MVGKKWMGGNTMLDAVDSGMEMGICSFWLTGGGDEWKGLEWRSEAGWFRQ